MLRSASASGIFFDRETFGADKLVAVTQGRSWSDMLAASPLPPKARRDIAQDRASENRLFSRVIVRPKEIAPVAHELSRIFAAIWSRRIRRLISFYQARTHGEWGVGIDAVSALDVWAFDFPGFQGLGLEAGSAPHMGYTAAGYADGGSYTFHFPDGNASIARLLVRDLIPEKCAWRERRRHRHRAARLFPS